jgi:hypothetical protein
VCCWNEDDEEKKKEKRKQRDRELADECPFIFINRNARNIRSSEHLSTYLKSIGRYGSFAFFLFYLSVLLSPTPFLLLLLLKYQGESIHTESVKMVCDGDCDGGI